MKTWAKNSLKTLLIAGILGLMYHIITPDFSEAHAANTITGDFAILADTIHDTVYVHDTVEIVHYVDTNVLVLHKKAFLYIKDTFNIDERTFYITEDDDTVKVFYHDYTYYIFKYFFQDTLVTIDSVIGCDLYTHCICDERERIVIFHTCEGESRVIVNMLNKQGK
ncbi:MAG: hypothetical protein JXA77_19065 [Bacteroidales bacterium]|nr:hypothetical protein [Bacteroidales bacterium]MBN2821391.1 hypothetical protein [Bacteroidales bacterium]